MAKRGRPTKYRPEYCDEIVEFMSQGYSPKAFAGHVGASYATIYRWADDYPDFRDALKIAQAASARWWEDRLRNIAGGGDGNAAAAIFGVKNRSQEEWREKIQNDHTSSDGSMTPPREVTYKVVDG